MQPDLFEALCVNTVGRGEGEAPLPQSCPCMVASINGGRGHLGIDRLVDSLLA